MERTKTDIKGFDKLINGGFPKESNILLTGTPGTGKTIFSLEYIYNGAKKKEKGIYFTFEEKKKSLIEQAEQFGWNFKKEEEKGNLKIISIGTDDISKNTIKEMIEIIKNSKTKRVVIDSITTLSFLTPEISPDGHINNHTIKRFLYSFITRLKEIEELTSIIISQKDEKISNNISEYLCDGVINIEYDSLGGDYSRNLTIKKMRKTKNSDDLHPLEISEKGIIIHDLE